MPEYSPRSPVKHGTGFGSSAMYSTSSTGSRLVSADASGRPRRSSKRPYAREVVAEAHDDLVRRARAVLDRNRCGTYTCPSVKLYPHQWLWDSCFTAIGIARFDPHRADDELRALFRGQWANGMLPHMIFAEGSTDIGSRRVWQSRRHPDAPRDVATSCITQPPIAAV